MFLDGVPLNPEGSSTFDLSELPLRAFDRVEVFRGSAPPRLGSAAVGGAVNLVPRESKTSVASLGAGSVGTLRGSGAVAGEEYLLFVDAFRTDGDFRWYDDRGTLFDTTDDRLRRRQNNDQAQGDILGRVAAGDDRLAVTVVNAFTTRSGGVPGFTYAPTERVRYGVTRDLLIGRLTGTRGAVRVSGSGYGLLRDEMLDDRLGEIDGGRRQAVGRSRSLGGRATLDWAASARVGVVGTADVREDWFLSRELITGASDPIRRRTVGRGTLSGTVAPVGETWVVVPVARIIATDRVELAPQLGFRVEPSRSVVLKGTAGRYVRVPDLVELYGDRGSSKGNPDLRSEVGLSADLAIQGTVEGDVGRAQLEAAGFWTHSRDRIVLVQNAQGTTLPLNLQNARVGGL